MVLIVDPPDARYAPLGRPANAPPQEVTVLVLPVVPAYQAQLQHTPVRTPAESSPWWASQPAAACSATACQVCEAGRHAT